MFNLRGGKKKTKGRKPKGRKSNGTKHKGIKQRNKSSNKPIS